MSAARRIAGKTFAALAVRNFRLYFFGQLVSVSGTWMQSVAQGWFVYQVSHHNAFALGLSVALQYVPMLLFGTFGGVVADRNEKRRILYFTQSGAGLNALLLAILVSTHVATVAWVYVLCIALGVVNLFDVPARQAFVQEMVGRELIANAVSLNSVLMNAGRLVGPAIATAFISALGTAACFYANSTSYVAVLGALVLMRADELTPIRRVGRAKGQLRTGLAYVSRTPVLRRVLLAVAVVGTFAFNFTVTLPSLTSHTFHDKSAASYGLLMGAMGLGAIAGGLFIAHRSRPTLGLVAALATAFGIFMTGVALAPSTLVAAVLLVPTGACSIAFVSSCNATLQLNSSEEMRGRVMSLHGMAFLGTTPIGATLVGWIIARSNPRVGLAVGALLTLATGLWLISELLTQIRLRKDTHSAVGA